MGQSAVLTQELLAEKIGGVQCPMQISSIQGWIWRASFIWVDIPRGLI